MSAALIEQFDLLATSTGGIARLRELILNLAVRGQLVPQDANDEPASQLLRNIRAEKDRLIAEGKIKRDKPLAEIGEDEKPHELPDSWIWIRLPDAYYSISPSSNKLLSSLIEDEGQFPVVDQGKTFIAGYTNDAELLIHLPGPVIVFGDHTKERKYVDFDFVAGADGTKILRPVQQNERYFYWYVCSLHLEGRGYARHFKVLNDNLYALPPLSEQSRIVAKVEELMALCDRFEAEQGHAARVQGHWVEAALDQLAESADADKFRRHWQHLAEHFDTLFTTAESIERLNAIVLQLAVRGKFVAQDPNDEPASELLKQIRAEKDRLIAEGKIKRDKPLPPITDDEKPYALQEGWEWVRLGTLGLTSTGGTPTTSNAEFFGTDVPFVKPADLRDMEITYQNDGLSFSGAEKVGVIQPESILMVCIGGSIGKLAYSPRLCSCNQQINSITPSVPAMSKTLLFFMAEAGFQWRVKDRAGVGTMPIISKGKWEQLPVPLPPLAEQARIVAQVEMMLALTAELKARLAAAQTKQAHLAEVMIQEALTV